MNTVRIPLTRGMFALIDEDDAALVECHKWHLLKNHTSSIDYAAYSYKNGDGKVRRVLMHRFITNAPEGMDVDHINGDGLDNRRSNMRVVTRSENLRNRRPGTKSKTGVLNVIPRGSRFEVLLYIQGKIKSFGQFATLADAAVAAYKARLEHYGPAAVARLPKPEGLQL